LALADPPAAEALEIASPASSVDAIKAAATARVTA
jgi:hypothetical protein